MVLLTCFNFTRICRYKKDDRNTNRFKECITMKKLTTMNSEHISIKLRKWGKMETIETDGK